MFCADVIIGWIPFPSVFTRCCSFEYRKTRAEEEDSLIDSHYTGRDLMLLLINNNNNPRLDTLTETASSFNSRISSVSFNLGYATKYDVSVNSLKERIVHPAWNEERPRLEVSLIKRCLPHRWTMTLWVSRCLWHKKEETMIYAAVHY